MNKQRTKSNGPRHMLTFWPRPPTLLLHQGDYRAEHLKSVFIANPEESRGDVPRSRSPLFPFPRCVCLRSNCGTNRNSMTRRRGTCRQVMFSFPSGEAAAATFLHPVAAASSCFHSRTRGGGATAAAEGISRIYAPRCLSGSK